MVPVGNTWTTRLVIQNLLRETILEHLKKKGLTPNTQGFLGKWQIEVTEMIESMDEGEIEKYTEMATTWNEVEPPEDIKRR
jgi:hypothetical protein